MERMIRRTAFAAFAAVLFGGAALACRAQRALLSDDGLAGAPCRRLPHAETLRLGVPFPSSTVEDRSPVNGILVSTLGTRKRCARPLRHASCGREGQGYTRVQADGTLEYFVLAASQAALLNVRGGAFGCIPVPPEEVPGRFSSRRRNGFRSPWA